MVIFYLHFLVIKFLKIIINLKAYFSVNKITSYSEQKTYTNLQFNLIKKNYNANIVFYCPKILSDADKNYTYFEHN